MSALEVKIRLIVCVLAVVSLAGLCRLALAGQETVGKSQTGETMQAADTQSPAAAACAQAVAFLQQQKGLISRELGQLKREMALLREDISKPGLNEIFAGIGYILGLAGIAFFVYCRKTYKKD